MTNDELADVLREAAAKAAKDSEDEAIGTSARRDLAEASKHLTESAAIMTSSWSPGR